MGLDICGVPDTLYKVFNIPLSQANRNLPFSKKHSCKCVSSVSVASIFWACTGSIVCMATPITSASVASAGIFNNSFNIVVSITDHRSSKSRQAFCMPKRKAWDITRSTEVLVKPIRKQVKPTQNVGANCLSCG